MHSVQASVPLLEPMTQTGIFSTLRSMDGSTAGPAGAGHFVKMVHNGIEYGIMQSSRRGF